MRQHILLPTDFSDNAMTAIKYTLKLYANEPCTFYFLHTWSFANETSRTYITSKFIDIKKEEAKQHLIDLKDKIASESTNPGHKFETVYSTESLLKTIENTIKEFNINLVVMGTRGASGAKEFIFGSNTVNIIIKIRLCPVLVIPDGYDFVKPEKIAFPTDFNRFYGDELQPLLQLTQLHNSKIRVLHINVKENLSEKQNYNLAMLKAYLEDCPSCVDWKPNFGTKEQTITDYINDNDINILAMINYEHSFIENFLKEPVIQKIGFHTIIPFLVIPEFK
ncbi:universal stress protein [Winogradskyella psychrotolerans]|uniref:universal stress protein n=1 Tax=Winogradskyella psychrotolerans TaxID=1344585 RepID=UPI001C06D2C1|nr:universal stress protein [Winogradskyella psychrotolerans]MBU2927653.1 universal stress protein [Winogradskyella psychrotolerans]